MIHTCEFLNWKVGDLPKPEKYKPNLTQRQYGKEELSSRQKRQIDVMAGCHEPIITPLPDYIHRDTGNTYDSVMDREYDKRGTPRAYNKNHNYKGDK